MTLKDAALPFILSLDIGTSAVRALVFDARGWRVAGIGARESVAVRTAPDGAAEIDASALFDTVGRCLDTALAQVAALAPPSALGGVAVTTLAATLLALDQHGAPLTPIFTYADTRCAQDAAALRARFDECEVHQRTGCLLRTGYWPAQLTWIRRTRPAIFRQAASWATLGDYLELRLFGRRRISYSAASWTGLLDRKMLSWDLRLLGDLGVRPGQLAPLVDRDAPIQGLLPEHTARWAELAEIPWFPAIGDGAAANVGSGCLRPTHAALTIGTTGALRVTLPDVERVPPGLWCYRIDRHRALLGGATSEGGNIVAWLRETLRIDEDPDTLDRALAALPPDGHGLTILPFWAGERSPGWAGNVRATIAGLSLGVTPLDILRAGMEAVACRFALILEQIEQAEVTPSVFVAGGGALLSSPAWMQIVTDVLGRPLTVAAESEVSARGAALLALDALGITVDAEVAAANAARFVPDLNNHARYREAIARQQALYRKIVQRDDQRDDAASC
ncbi:MAG: gluconokinase [Roseiflexus sp.]|nr:gluconokinase [Roseiflexus sp.]MCS7287805.1 gluconokinase [Roseiflexus sp.]MDW8145681.1 gluconokinase [Roseiflexaceae bacterium]MDW8232121.1 gluconokinase [Roseiflexaceae bacterium]